MTHIGFAAVQIRFGNSRMQTNFKLRTIVLTSFHFYSIFCFFGTFILNIYKQTAVCILGFLVEISQIFSYHIQFKFVSICVTEIFTDFNIRTIGTGQNTKKKKNNNGSTKKKAPCSILQGQGIRTFKWDRFATRVFNRYIGRPSDRRTNLCGTSPTRTRNTDVLVGSIRYQGL